MTEARTSHGQGAGSETSKFMTFKLANEEYGLEILKVRELIGMMEITRIPRARSYIRGVINLRGKVIPVVDLRLKFGFASQDYTERTCIIVVEVALPSGAVMMGIIVDHVSEVLNITPEEIEQTPEFGERVETTYMKGIAKVKGKVKILLDLDRVLGSDGTVAMPRVA